MWLCFGLLRGHAAFDIFQAANYLNKFLQVAGNQIISDIFSIIPSMSNLLLVIKLHLHPAYEIIGSVTKSDRNISQHSLMTLTEYEFPRTMD